jgi:acyl carrier protein
MVSGSQISTYPPAGSVDRLKLEALNFSLAELHIFLNLFQFFILPPEVHMKTGTIAARVIAELAKTMKTTPERIQVQANLIEDLEIDSLDILDLIFQLEEEFGIEIPRQAQLQFFTVQDVIEYVQRRVGHPFARLA